MSKTEERVAAVAMTIFLVWLLVGDVLEIRAQREAGVIRCRAYDFVRFGVDLCVDPKTSLLYSLEHLSENAQKNRRD